MRINHLKQVPLFEVSAQRWSKSIDISVFPKDSNGGPYLVQHTLSIKEARAFRKAIDAQIKNIKRRKKS